MATTEAASRPAALPARLYRDPDVVELEHRRIFERTWQFAAHVSALPNPGSYITANAGRQPVLVLRDQDGSCARSATSAVIAARGCSPDRASAARRSAVATTAGPTGSTAT